MFVLLVKITKSMKCVQKHFKDPN
uniref:Uncharacterized protein n=1 Tax=Anguilla anguilla TaxID=7936 RepID=A0A0E9XR76_ANGAN